MERLKQAIEKARVAREGKTGGVRDAVPVVRRSSQWDAIEMVTFDARRAESNRVTGFRPSDDTNISFDILRTNVLKIVRANGWTSLAIASPTKGCGKSVVGVNLAFSIARNPDMRVLFVELDMRAPSLARMLGLKPTRFVQDVLSGDVEPEAACMRLTPNLAVAASRLTKGESAELLLLQATQRAIEGLRGRLAPDLTIFDLPPLFGCDDAVAFLPNAEGLLLVAAAGQTTAEQIAECESLVERGQGLAGVVLNKVDDRGNGYRDRY